MRFLEQNIPSMEHTRERCNYPPGNFPPTEMMSVASRVDRGVSVESVGGGTEHRGNLVPPPLPIKTFHAV